MRKIFLITLAIFFVSNIAGYSQQIKNRKSQIEIIDAWIRPGAQGSNSALFFEVVSKGGRADTLIAVKSNLADIAEVHETYKKENDMMGMREVHKVVIPAKGIVKFKPRGLHVMLIGLFKDVRVKEEHVVTLVFRNAGVIKMKAVVRDMPKMK